MTESYPRSPLAKLLRSSIKSSGLSLRELARIADVGYEELRRFYDGRSGAMIETLERLFRALNFEVIDDGIMAALRAAIEADPRTQCELASDAGVCPQTIGRFMGGEGLRGETADRLLSVLPHAPELVRERNAAKRAGPIARRDESGPISNAIRSLLIGAGKRIDGASNCLGIPPSYLRQFVAGDVDLLVATAGQIIGWLGFGLKLSGDPENLMPRSLQSELRALILASGVATNRISRRSGVAYQTIRGFVDGYVDIRLSTADRIARDLDAVVSVVELVSPIAPGATSPLVALAAEVLSSFKASGLTPNAVARRSGLAAPTVRRVIKLIENNGPLRSETLAKLAKGLGGEGEIKGQLARPCPVELRGHGVSPLIYGAEMQVLRDPEYQVINALIQEYESGGFDLKGLKSKSGVSAPHKTLARMLEKTGYQPWQEVIELAGSKGGRYRIVDRRLGS